ncbi:MAG: Bug family tripartite tricarboxylate transporter substrate binding protein [Rhodospirillaceae bacterium]
MSSTLIACWLGAAAAALAMPPACASSTQSWPSKPVHIVVPAPAGSSLDVVARVLSEKLWPMWNRPVVVENKPGAGGLIGVDAAAKAQPDGHVLALGFNGPLAFAPFLYSKMPYDVGRDLAPVILASSQPNVLAVTATLPPRSVASFIAWARAQPPRTLGYASIGSGSSSHLAMELFIRQAGFAAVHVPYQGSPAAALSVARGETQLLFAVASGVMPQAQSGQIRLLAVTSAQRFQGLEQLPTLAESGFPGFVADAWNGLVAAAATPAPVVDRINADVLRVLASREVQGRLRTLGMAAGGGTPASFGTLIESERKRWGPVIRQADIRLE